MCSEVKRKRRKARETEKKAMNKEAASTAIQWHELRPDCSRISVGAQKLISTQCASWRSVEVSFYLPKSVRENPISAADIPGAEKTVDETPAHGVCNNVASTKSISATAHQPKRGKILRTASRPRRNVETRRTKMDEDRRFFFFLQCSTQRAYGIQSQRKTASFNLTDKVKVCRRCERVYARLQR